ncbi:MAG: SDR family NAD(P)-dependent oxidoreductase [Rhodospirillales bacterium]|nr:SDR family NAD(P)-dependent oxidoreductase [Rhodospirillales bacterium]
MPDSSGRKVVWITGAGKGIGRALAKRLASEGWSVAASARTEADLLSLQGECVEGGVHVFPLDVTDAEQNQKTISQIESQMGPLDLVVLNAGTHKANPAETFSVEAFRVLVESNLMGPVNGLAPIMARFIDRKSGHIAVVGSLAGYRGLPTASAYGATKAGLINMCEALKVELEPHNVRITLVNPGFVKTPLTDQNPFPMPFLISVDEAVEQIIRGLNMDRFEITFPKRFSFIMKLLRVLPDPLFFALSRRIVTP